MNATADHELVAAYASKASEAAFQALVNRHVNLVYATALRQLGDPALAEEVCQDVFIILARKAPRLAGRATLAGWLHRSTILEAKARIRAELRRRRREVKAGELIALQTEGASALASLVPLLDEALLHLRDNDRLALILRFFEDRSLRDVAAVLGVDEDAARKRVSRALARLTEFFRARGWSIPAGSGVGAVLAGGVSAAPAGLAASAAQAGLAAGGAAGGTNLLYLQIMALTKTQTAVVCALLATAPLLWQKQVQGRVAQEQAQTAARIATASQKADELEAAVAMPSCVRSPARSMPGAGSRLWKPSGRAQRPLQPTAGMIFRRSCACRRVFCKRFPSQPHRINAAT